ncbi:MAG: hypothetical protein ACREJ5_27355 [Geminicoccaceae bacterium]
MGPDAGHDPLRETWSGAATAILLPETGRDTFDQITGDWLLVKGNTLVASTRFV